MVLDASGNPIFKSIALAEATDVLRDVDGKALTVVAQKGDVLVAEEVDADGVVTKMAAVSYKPVVAETNTGGVTPLDKSGQIAYGGKNTRHLEYLAKPAAGKDYKLSMKNAATKPE